MIQSSEPATKRDLAKRVILHALRTQISRSFLGLVESRRTENIFEPGTVDRFAVEVLDDLDRPFLYPALRVLAGAE